MTKGFPLPFRCLKAVAPKKKKRKKERQKYATGEGGFSIVFAHMCRWPACAWVQLLQSVETDSAYTAG